MHWSFLLTMLFLVFGSQIHLILSLRFPSAPTNRDQSSFSVIFKNPSLGPNGEKLWEKDILITEDKEKKFALEGFHSNPHSTNSSHLLKWPKGIIPYLINENVQFGKSIIETSMKQWSENTCITFRETNTKLDNHYIHIKETGTGCNSWIGILDISIKEQTVSLDTPCLEIPIVTHELGHAIGLWHQQDRPDKDEYLKIYLLNMKPSDRNYFQPSTGNEVETFGVPYDYGSIMQYDAFAFSNNGRMTLVPLNPLGEALMGRATRPSFYDYKLVNSMYNCSEKCDASALKCYHGGFKAWNEVKGCFCVCPEGHRGSMCETRLPTKETTCGGRFTAGQRIETPNFPYHHPANIKCVWWFEAPSTKKIQIHFTSFNILFRYDEDNTCVWESMRIRSREIFSDDPGEVYCGRELHGKTLISEHNHMVLALTTISNQFGTGFAAKVAFV